MTPESCSGGSQATPPNPSRTRDAQFSVGSHFIHETVQILETHKRLEALIDRLPDVSDGEQAQLERIVALQERNEAASEELQRELTAVKAQLRDTQDVYAVLADDVLRHRTPEPALQREH